MWLDKICIWYYQMAWKSLYNISIPVKFIYNGIIFLWIYIHEYFCNIAQHIIHSQFSPSVLVRLLLQLKLPFPFILQALLPFRNCRLNISSRSEKTYYKIFFVCFRNTYPRSFFLSYFSLLVVMPLLPLTSVTFQC